jgi:hypothetical protein
VSNIPDQIPYSGHGWGAFVCRCPVGTPAATEDGRPFVPKDEDKPLESLLWIPNPPRDGDPVYCRGVLVGTFHGDDSQPCEWSIVKEPISNLTAATMKSND